ncbi:MAG: hypothetical protein ACXWK7_07880 [Caulobacteraceae bacterium]
MRVRLGAIMMAAGLAAAPALTQVAAPSVPRGEAKSEGDALLGQAGAADLFDNVTADDAQDIKLRHKASGVICEFNTGAASNRVVVFDAARRGDDIACSTGGAAGERTLYASRTPGRTLADAFAHDLAEVRKNHPGAVDYALPPGTDSPILQMLDIPPMPPSKTARFIVDHQFTSVSSAVVKDWSLEFRFTCPEEHQDLAAGSLQPTLWVTILAQISGAPLDLVSPKQAV